MENRMETTTTIEEKVESFEQTPGAFLAESRKQKGYSQEYVASKLHLRVKIIDLLESDNYEEMPEPVFIKGYLRAYAKLLEIEFEPLLSTYNQDYAKEKKLDKTLWQSQREANNVHRYVKWFTLLFFIGVLVSISVWWQKNKDNRHDYINGMSKAKSISNTPSDVHVTDLTKMKSLISQDRRLTPMEQDRG